MLFTSVGNGGFRSAIVLACFHIITQRLLLWLLCSGKALSEESAFTVSTKTELYPPYLQCFD
jgi:hypothetical protein